MTNKESGRLEPCTLLFRADDRESQWRDAFDKYAPAVRFRAWPDWDPEDNAEYALVWKPPKGELARHGSLKGVFSIGAGLDHFSSDPDLPTGVPVIRMVDPGLTSGMSEFVVMSVLHHHRLMTTYRTQQSEKVWQIHKPIAAGDRRVGVMGTGVLGTDVLNKLSPFGFRLRGWSRTDKDIDGVETFSGDGQKNAFLRGLDILICLLPLTTETRRILNRRTFEHLSDGATVINVGRGEHLVEEDLLEALDSGKIGCATLDVFQQEPLPDDHPLWIHPGVVITPHIASMTSPMTAVPAILEQIHRYQKGSPFTHVADLTRGY